jgi:hypothetical protein
MLTYFCLTCGLSKNNIKVFYYNYKMRVKLSEKYQNEREEICKTLISILELDENQCFLLCELDKNIEKQNKLLELKDEIKKYFSVSCISTFRPNFECKRPYLNIVRSILRKQNYDFEKKEIEIPNGDGSFFRTTKYKIFRNN